MRNIVQVPAVVFLFLNLLIVNIYSQVASESYPGLKLESSGRSVENKISLDISDSDYQAMSATSGEKITVRARVLIINGDTLLPEEISTRGQSTLQFKRKSLSFRLKTKASFFHGERKDSFTKFTLLNLAMDKYYFHNRLAFEMLEKIGIFNLFYSFCEMSINGKSEGIYMVVERPEDWALKEDNSPFVIRRGYDHKIEKMKSDSKSERADTKKNVNDYRLIYKSLNKYKGKELYDTLSSRIDIDFYMKWVAFNFLVRNGDYSDEVFFYVDPEIRRFRIIPWDYDDIFAIAPHEGIEESKRTTGDKLLFSTEDELDKKIAADPYLYGIYLTNLKQVLEMLSPAFIKKVFENCYNELYPFYSDKDIISNSQFDLYKEANPEKLRNDLVTTFLGLNSWRTHLLDVLGNNTK